MNSTVLSLAHDFRTRPFKTWFLFGYECQSDARVIEKCKQQGFYTNVFTLKSSLVCPFFRHIVYIYLSRNFSSLHTFLFTGVRGKF